MPDYALMNQLLYEGNANEVERMTKEALAEGRTVQEVLNEGLIAGMSVVGEDFKHNVLYVPEVLIAARAMKAGMSVLKPLLTGFVAPVVGPVRSARQSDLDILRQFGRPASRTRSPSVCASVSSIAIGCAMSTALFSRPGVVSPQRSWPPVAPAPACSLRTRRVR